MILALTRRQERGNSTRGFVNFSQRRISLSKPEWGTKRLCRSCGCRFYDLRRTPVVCPRCDATFEIDAGAKPRRPAAPRGPVHSPVKEKSATSKRPIDDETPKEDAKEDAKEDVNAGAEVSENSAESKADTDGGTVADASGDDKK